MTGFCLKCNDFRGDGFEWDVIVKRGSGFCEKCESKLEMMEW
jgi:hypothetical protein